MKVRKIGLAAMATLSLALTTAVPAFAGSPDSVGTTAATFTPWLLKDPVYQQVDQLLPCGPNMYAVGTISAIGKGKLTYSRGNGFSFSQTTGAVTAWDPQVNGEVHSIAFNPDCSVAYLGGKFTSVHGATATNFAAVDTTTGAQIPGIVDAAPGEVDSIVYTATQGLLVGGTFTKIKGVARSHFASLDPTNGKVTAFANLSVTGTYPSQTTRFYNMQLSHAGDRLLVEGVFTAINGTPRQQVAVIDLTGTTAALNGWYAPEFNTPCINSESFYTRDGAWSPDDLSIYTVETGYHPLTGPGTSTRDPRGGLCDAAAAFPSDATTITHKWINYTGCDSYFSVVADAGQVYVGGHQRWVNNPNGCDAPGPGALARPGIASLDPNTGLATNWNPTRSLGHGADDLVLTDAGLWIASDTWKDGNSQKCAGKSAHGGICFLPY